MIIKEIFVSYSSQYNIKMSNICFAYIDEYTFKINKNRGKKIFVFLLLREREKFSKLAQSLNVDFHDSFQIVRPHTKLCFQPCFMVSRAEYVDALRKRNVIRN